MLSREYAAPTCQVCGEPVLLTDMYHLVPEAEAAVHGLRGGAYHARCLPRELENLESA